MQASGEAAAHAEANALWERAIEADPNHFETLYTFGSSGSTNTSNAWPCLSPVPSPNFTDLRPPNRTP
jgi:hypothetical protein